MAWAMPGASSNSFWKLWMFWQKNLCKQDHLNHIIFMLIGLQSIPHKHVRDLQNCENTFQTEPMII